VPRCATRRTCRRCGQRWESLRHARAVVVIPPDEPSLRELRCPRCGYEFTLWMAAVGASG